jgi:hypothetical protein
MSWCDRWAHAAIRQEMHRLAREEDLFSRAPESLAVVLRRQDAADARRRRRRRFGLVLIAVLVAGGTLFFSPFLVDPLVNEWRLYRLVVVMNQLRHPPRSRHLLRIEAIGLLHGASAHCDYLVLEVRTHEGDRKKAETYYSGQTYVSPTSGERSELDFVWLDGMDPRRFELPDRYRDPELWGLPANVPRAQLYAVWAFDQDFRFSGDFRCG